MNITENILAKKYATAFLNLYLDTISYDDYIKLKQVASYFKSNKLFFLLNIPTIPIKKKHDIILELFEELHIPKSLNHLVLLVLKQHRIFLIPVILEQLVQVYERRKKIMHCTIASSYALKPEQLEVLKNFLEKITQYHIVYTPYCDKTLIAGIRMQSKVFVWEYSLAKQLRALRKTMG